MRQAAAGRDDHEPVAGPASEAEQEPGRVRYRNAASHLMVEWIRSILIAFVLFVFIRTFLVEAYRIPTGSMEKSLLVGDFLLVNKAVFGAHVPFTHAQLPAFSEPKRGDIVVFVPPHVQDQNYVKRLIGAPGDTVEMRAKALYVNGVVKREPYARYGSTADNWSPAMGWQCDYRPPLLGRTDCRPTRDNWGPIVVPAGHYLMLGDNRDDSEDSRYWGFIDRDAMRGKPLVVYYSFEATSDRDMPWFTAIRWSRIGARPH
jgi:signal peptidase I